MRAEARLLLCILGSAAPLDAQNPEVVRLYRAGVEAASAGNLPGGIAAMDSALAIDPEIPNAYWNLGLWHSALERPRDALAAWQAYRRLDSTDWHVRAKMIQAYQALGDTAARNRERLDLLTLREAGTDTALGRFQEYCREQYRVGPQRVMAFETFEPEGDRRVFLTFYVKDSTGADLGHFSLGSYDGTTQIARETGSIGPNDRVYHLDWYATDYHATIMFFREMPTYEDTRELVAAVLKGERNPISSTQRL